MKKTIIAILVIWLGVPAALAANQTEFEEILSEIELVRVDIQKSTASFLLIVKQMDVDETDSLQTEEGQSEQKHFSVDPQISGLAERLYSTLQNRYERANALFAQFDNAYRDLSSAEKAEASSVHTEYLSDKVKIQTYMAYANHYHEQFQSFQASGITKSGRNEISYEGTVSLRLGTSSYEAPGTPGGGRVLEF